MQSTIVGAKLYFLDETGINTKMTRLRGRSSKGSQVRCSVPYRSWQTSTFIAALNGEGLIAPMVLDGPMNGEAFLAYTKNFLCPVLREGDWVILDNLSSHKVVGVREAIKSVGAEILYLLPYSPDFNPIEQVFAKLRAYLRKSAKRDLKTLLQALSECLESFSPADCKRYIQNSGYCI